MCQDNGTFLHKGSFDYFYVSIYLYISGTYMYIGDIVSIRNITVILFHWLIKMLELLLKFSFGDQITSKFLFQNNKRFTILLSFPVSKIGATIDHEVKWKICILITSINKSEQIT